MLERFEEAQKRSYSIALQEIQSGRKQSHWMWFIFPQIKGLGYSEISKYYAIQSLDEAKDYLNHPILGTRLREIAEALIDLDTNDAHAVFGNPEDLKLRSSMTLFDYIESNSVFGKVLEKFYGGNRDLRTLEIINEI